MLFSKLPLKKYQTKALVLLFDKLVNKHIIKVQTNMRIFENTCKVIQDKKPLKLISRSMRLIVENLNYQNNE